MGGAIQLADLPAHGIAAAPFPVLRELRKRSSSLGAAQHFHQANNQPIKAHCIDIGEAVAPESEMPNLWRSSSKKVKDGFEGSTAGKGLQGNRQKITEKGRERRLSSAGVLQHLRLSVASSPKQTSARAQSRPAEQDVAMSVDVDVSCDGHEKERHDAVGRLLAPFPNEQAIYALSRESADGTDSEDEDEDENITEQRARAYAALIGGRPSPSGTSARVRATSMHTKATASCSQPALVPMCGGSSAIPRRRTTSSNDAPTMAERSSKSAALPADKVFDGTRIGGNRPRRTRVQSANAAAGGVGAFTSKTSIPAATRRKRRSLSQENSLVATRLARAFLARELGETVITRRPATAHREHWSNDESEQRDLWLALQDGVVLCRYVAIIATLPHSSANCPLAEASFSLLNHIVPDAIKYIDRRDTSSARAANISNFLASAKTHLPLEPHEFFDVTQLVGSDLLAHSNPWLSWLASLPVP